MKRKEVHLDEKVVEALQKKADELGRTLKRHMEMVLISDSKKKVAKFQ